MLILGLVLVAFVANANTTNDLVEESSSYQDNFLVAKFVPYSSEKFNPCSCVSFAKQYLGLPKSIRLGNAWNIKPNISYPVVGGLILTQEGPGHVAVITSINGDQISVLEANWKPCKVTQRVIPLDFPLIRGYWVF